MKDDEVINFSASVDEAIARNVKRARERAGMSQAEVARLMSEAELPGIHQTTIARIESGQRTLKLAEALILARILEYRVEDLVESGATAALRSNYSYLAEGVSKFREAAKELLFRKAMVAESLDRDFPHGDAQAHAAAYMKVNPSAYEIVDELLSNNSEPAWLVGEAYEEVREQLSERGPEPFVASRAMDLLESAIEYSWRTSPYRDRSSASAQEFEEVLHRIEGAERWQA